MSQLPPVPTRVAWLKSVARRLGEIAIVTIGILIAFALDAWWDNRATAAQEQVHLRALASDLQQNVTALKSHIEVENAIIESCRQLLEIARADGEPPPLGDHINQVFSSGRYDPVMGAYEALVNSGGLTLIRDEQLRAALAEFAARTRGQYEESWTDQHYFAFARDFAGRIAMLHLQRTGAEAAQREYQAMLAEPKFLEHLALRYYSERDIGQKYSDLLRQAEALLVQLQAQIPASD